MKPMLAAATDGKGLSFPLFASPKLDGVRALVQNGKVVSRNLKPVPNRYVQNALPYARMEGLDGELIVGNPWDKDCFRNTTSGVMSEDGEPKFNFWMFDIYNCQPFDYRYKIVKQVIQSLGTGKQFAKLVPQVVVRDEFELYEYEQLMLEKGFEGVMLRHANSPYKFGRSTLKEGYLLKLKRFEDSEARVLDCVELLHNKNEAKINALGNKERSSHKANKVAGGVLGSLRVVDLKTGVEFDIGSGFTAKDRDFLWKWRDDVVGKIAKYKYFPTGSKDKPRFPVFLGFRDEQDM